MASPHRTAWPAPPSSAIVVGAGAVGLCAAWSLSSAGVQVTVLDAGDVGRGSSWGNAGWLVPSLSAPLAAPGMAAVALKTLGRPTSPFWVAPRADRELLQWFWKFWRAGNATRFDAGYHATAALAETTFELFDKLAADVGGFEYRTDGMLFAFLDEHKAAAELAALEPNRAHGYDLPTSIMTGDEMRRLEPALSGAVQAGILLEQERHVDPGALTAALAATLRSRGVSILEHSRVTAIDTSPSRVHVATPGARHDADIVILAAGAWTPEVAATVGIDVPMQAAKGYSVTAALPTPPSRPLYLGEAKVGVTPFAGRTRLAGTFELSGVNLDVNRNRVRAMLRGARPFLSSWDPAGISDVWTGMRPMSPDSLPIIGPAPGQPRVVLATGHGMLGVTLAASTGDALVRGLLDGAAPSVLEPFDPGRF